MYCRLRLLWVSPEKVAMTTHAFQQTHWQNVQRFGSGGARAFPRLPRNACHDVTGPSQFRLGLHACKFEHAPHAIAKISMALWSTCVVLWSIEVNCGSAVVNCGSFVVKCGQLWQHCGQLWSTYHNHSCTLCPCTA